MCTKHTVMVIRMILLRYVLVDIHVDCVNDVVACKVWVSMFEALLKGSDSYVPAVIVPMYHPNVQTWNIIKRPAEL